MALKPVLGGVGFYNTGLPLSGGTLTGPLTINAPTGFSGKILDVQLNGSSLMSVDNNGSVSLGGSFGGLSMQANAGFGGLLLFSGLYVSGPISGGDASSKTWSIQADANNVASFRGLFGPTSGVWVWNNSDLTNYERFASGDWTASSNVCQMGCAAGGTGTLRQWQLISPPRLPNYAVGSLPSASTMGAGARAFVTDSNATLSAGLGNTVAAGGSNKVPVYSDGTNWKIG